MSELSLSRRTFIGSVGAGALVVPHAHAAATPLAVTALLADGLDSPTAVHGQRVRLSWQLVSDRRGAEQKAYRIGVASSRDKAQAGSFDLWDSGRIESGRSVDIAYGGPPLASRTRCHWTVTVWDDQGAQATSAVARWEMGLLSPSDWQGDWIAAETGIVRDDRLAGLPWMTGAQPQPGAGRSFRLVLDLPEPAELVVHSAVNRKPEAMLDGVALTYPVQHFAAMGPRPTYRSTHRVAAGRHVLSLFVAADRPDDVDPRAAVMVRATLASGRILRFAGDRLRTAAGKPADWAAARVDDRAWSPAVPIAGSGEAPMPGNGAFLLRRGFALREAPRAARLYVTALGAYLSFVNGEKVGDALLAPEWTDYRRHLLYRAYDVTALLKPGANLLGAMVGDGWYGSFTAPTGRWSYGKPPLRLRAQLEIEHADGRRETIATDDRWSVAPSMITASEIYNGEDVDARLDRPGWSAAGAAPGPDWEPACAIETPPIAMLGASVQPIGAAQTLRPVKLTAIAPGSAVVDFGQNFAGWVRLRARGKSGQRITLRFAELLLPDGRVDQSNLRAARAADTWILRGGGVERFEPHFTYHGFRYVQIDGLGEPLAPDDVEGVVLHSTLPETGQLTLGQHVPQRLWQNALWSQRSNFFGIPTDCPQRDERLGWTGDAHVFWDAACFNMDAAAFTRKFLRDMRDAQRAGGDFPDIAPNSDIAHFTPPGSSPGWADAGIFLPWTSWRRYGDTAVIDEHWQAMARYLDSIHAGNPGLLWRTGRGNDFGDWLAFDAKQPGDPTTPKNLVATAMWKGTADAMADMAAATGRRDDADRYRALADGIGRAFNAAFVRPDGSIGNGSQTGYILALHFGIVPPTLRQTAADRLVADIVRRGTLLSTGFLGTPYSLDVLADAGRATLVYDLLLRTAFPSWGYMIAKSATTIWERWNGDVGDVAMNSFNHYALGAVAGFMFRRLAGIDPVEPGFARFRFDPVYDPRMPQGGGRYDSRVGRIETAWRQTPGGDFTLRLQVPANARCTLSLPARSSAQVREGGRALARVHGIERRSGDKVTLEVGGGRYDFTVSGADYG